MKITRAIKAQLATVAFQVAMGLLSDSEAILWSFAKRIAQALDAITAAVRGVTNAPNP